MDAFVTFEPALRRGEINLQPGEVDSNVHVLQDLPNGEPRLTYVRLERRKVTAMAIIIMAEPYEGERCFQIGYAVPEKLRGQGRAKDIATAAIAELSNGLSRNGVQSFYIEAVVGQGNAPSRRVAEAVVGGKAREIVDEISGEAALQYMRKIEL
jgi:RimJ/RimL family protein N-acetyltransferase